MVESYYLTGHEDNKFVKLEDYERLRAFAIEAGQLVPANVSTETLIQQLLYLGERARTLLGEEEEKT